MNGVPEEFDRLRKLIAVKRHEQPPPRFFDQLSGRIMERLEHEESLRASRSSWWRILTESVQPGPAFACAYGLAVAGLLAAGFTVSADLTDELEAGADYTYRTLSVGGDFFAVRSAPEFAPAKLGLAGRAAFHPAIGEWPEEGLGGGGFEFMGLNPAPAGF